MILRIVVAVCLLAVAAGPAAAQSTPFKRPPREPDFTRDANILQAIREKKAGAVAFDIEVVGIGCEEANTTVVRMVNGQTVHFVTITNDRRVSFSAALRIPQGGMSSMTPGNYLVSSVFCKSGNSRSTLNGPYAAFQVRPGEVVNLGVLRLETVVDNPSNIFTRQVTGLKKSVKGMPPEVRTKMKEEFPQAFPLAVERRMTLVGPAEVSIKQR
jgi:hypothetical protein